MVAVATDHLRLARGAILAHLDDGQTKRIRAAVKMHPDVPLHLWSKALRTLIGEGVISRTRLRHWSPVAAPRQVRRWRYRLTLKGAQIVAAARAAVALENRPRIILPGD